MKKETSHIDEAIFLRIIEDTADDQERNLFERWVEASVMHAETFEQFKKAYQLSFIDVQAKQKNWESIVRKVKEGKEVPGYIELPGTQTFSINLRMKTFLRIAAMLIIFLGLSFFIKIIVFNPEQLVVSGKDLKQNVPYQLADGSLVYLNGNSEISFSKKFGEKDRKISLKGEAFFEVQRNEKMPFVISTNKTTTRVLGTSFNVYSDQSGQVRVSVVSGIVEFYTGKRKELVRLIAGEQGNYSPRLKGIEKVKIDNPNFQAWKTGILTFNETPLSVAFRLLQGQYSRVFVFENKQDGLPTLTTTIDNQTLEAVLEELNLLLNTKNVTRNDTIFFKSNN
jgi:transmembrane sensor